MSSIRVCYQTIEFSEVDIHVRSLRDKQEYSDPLGEAAALGISSAQWSLFGIVWESGKILAREMAGFDIDGKRMLEVGCGMALSSLLLKSRNADITATDYHPEAGSFLIENVRLNKVDEIPFLCTSWENLHDGLGKFDVIIGADILYEKQHVALLSAFINRHANPKCEVLIVDPGRGNHASFCKKMVGLGYARTRLKQEKTSFQLDGAKGHVLRFVRNCAAGIG